MRRDDWLRERSSRSGFLVSALVITVALAFATAAEVVRPVPPPTAHTETCVSASCHADLVQQDFVHAPTARQKCLACHLEDEPREHRFRLAEHPDGLCASCHVKRHRTYVHEPLRQGQCTGCHDPHGGDRRLFLHEDPTAGLCLECHQEHGGAGAAFVHGPVATGACILCHEAHSSWQPALLTEDPQQLCGRCHADVFAAAAEARHHHPPVSRDCLACHDAHASDVPSQLRQEAPELCYSCHGEIREAVAELPVVHGALTEPAGCRRCHEAHGSELPKLQAQSQTRLCLECHDRVLTATDGRTIPNMAALLSDNPNHHGPVRDGACSACHLPHAADHRQLLRKAYPADFYADYEPARYELCFDCHIADMVTSSHGPGLTRFRDGDVNLHWLHVNRERGRTCRACHEVHASSNPFHMRDSVPYGTSGWSLDINFLAADDGGSCSPGCHELKAYARDVRAGQPRAAAGPDGGAP
ncbi:MAG: cytochrome c3 family protein [Planctomycetota bacterium]|jgi:predicted CXXCH cytochrome family protein